MSSTRDAWICGTAVTNVSSREMCFRFWCMPKNDWYNLHANRESYFDINWADGHRVTLYYPKVQACICTLAGKVKIWHNEIRIECEMIKPVRRRAGARIMTQPEGKIVPTTVCGHGDNSLVDSIGKSSGGSLQPQRKAKSPLVLWRQDAQQAVYAFQEAFAGLRVASLYHVPGIMRIQVLSVDPKGRAKAYVPV